MDSERVFSWGQKMKIDFWKAYAVIALLALIVFGYYYIQINRYYYPNRSENQVGFGRIDNITNELQEYGTANKWHPYK